MSLTDFLKHDNSNSSKSASGGDSTQQARVIIDNIEDGVILFDNAQNIKLINPGAALLCGWNVDDAAGSSTSTN